jgi:hypothetical protein
MTVRVALGASWALAVGLAGGWLMLTPWALGQQASGKDWTSVTRTEFFTGLGLVVLAVLGLGLLAMQIVRALREAGVLAPAVRGAAGAANGSRSAGAPDTSSPEFESALIGLAQALTRELQSSPPGRPETGIADDPARLARRQEDLR